ncbi:50S ribosomal protein L17 [Candidatus Curtissbacteria bacterium]|nr:50S ribosomal protein L17 [Candidatus Curtissbacteria bacterium]
MRHLYFGRRLGRDTNARKALAGNLASALFLKGQVVTTLAKAKFARSYVEKLITRAKTKNDLAASRVIASRLRDQAFSKLRDAIGPGFAERRGGYTRIIRLLPRTGDAAPMAKLELLPIEKDAAKKSKGAKPVSQRNEKHKTN